MTRDNLLLRMKPEEWQTVLDVNLTGAFHWSRTVLKTMLRQRWGRIVNIASIVGVTGNAGQANYAASKAGLIGFSKSLAQEVASRNVTVNVIAPGFIESEMTAALGDDAREAYRARIPLGRLGSGADVAAVALFLASPLSVLLHLIVLGFVLYHAITWYNLTPNIMVVRRGEEQVPPVLVAGLVYAGWIGLSALILIFVLRG